MHVKVQILNMPQVQSTRLFRKSSLHETFWKLSSVFESSNPQGDNKSVSEWIESMLESEKNKLRKVFRARRFRRLRDVVWHCFNEEGVSKVSLISSQSRKSFMVEIIMSRRKDLFLFEIRNFSMSNHQVIHKSSFKSVSEQFWCVRVSLKGETVGDFLWRGFLWRKKVESGRL